MKKSFIAALPVAVLAAASTAFAEPILFGPVKAQPGESIRLVTYSQAKDGTIQRRVNGEPSSGKISIERNRELHWTFRTPEADGSRRGMVRIVRLSTETKIKIDGEEEIAEDVSPLTGKMLALTKPPGADWDFQMDGSFPLEESRKDIDEMKVY